MSGEQSKLQEEHNQVMTVTEWRDEASRRFGPDPMNWRFVCPACKFEQSVADYHAAGAPEGAVAFSCVGRWRADVDNAAFDGSHQGPCNYAGGGLFRLNPVTVLQPGGDKHTVFAFADAKEDAGGEEDA